MSDLSGGQRLAAVLPARPAGGTARSEPPTVPFPAVGPGVVGPVGSSLVVRVAAALRRFVPAGWLASRVDPGRPGATALALVAAAAALLAAVGVWSGRPRAEPVGALPAVTAASTAPAPAAAGPLVVSVVGKVRRPGLVQVPDGARVADVLAAAGGPLPGVDVAGVNLARKVGDGEQIAVGISAPPPDANPGDGPDATAGGSTAAAAGGGPLDLNRASAAQLDGLPGVGPVTAERIVDWRTRHGRFSRVEQLREIDGIGERRFGRLRELVRVS